MRINQRWILLISSLLVFSSAGCTTTKSSREDAAYARDLLERYMQDRHSAIDRLNAAARSTYGALLYRYRNDSASDVLLKRVDDARAAADALLLDPVGLSTRTSLVSMVEGARDRQLDSIRHRADALRIAQTRYAESYSELALDVDRLKLAVAKLDLLSRPPNFPAQAAKFISRLVETYQDQAPTSDGLPK